MNYKIKTPCEKLFPGCYGDQPRVVATKEEAVARCQELNEKPGQEPGLIGTFSYVETNDPVPVPAPEPEPNE